MNNFIKIAWGMGKSTRLCYQLTCKGVGKGGAEAPQILSSCMLLGTQAVTAKGHSKCRKTREEKKNSFQVISSVTHTKIKA